MTQKITTNLWFDDNAEDAANFYISLFEDSRIVSIARYTEAGPGEPGKVMVVEWEMAGQRFIGINGGPAHKLTEAVSLQVNCADQAEVDHYWDALREGGGQEGPCGWLKDRFGLSWQVTPPGMDEIFSDPDPERANRAMKAMFGMRKLDLAALQAAADGVAVS